MRQIGLWTNFRFGLPTLLHLTDTPRLHVLSFVLQASIRIDDALLHIFLANVYRAGLGNIALDCTK